MEEETTEEKEKKEEIDTIIIKSLALSIVGMCLVCACCVATKIILFCAIITHAYYTHSMRQFLQLYLHSLQKDTLVLAVKFNIMQ